MAGVHTGPLQLVLYCRTSSIEKEGRLSERKKRKEVNGRKHSESIRKYGDKESSSRRLPNATGSPTCRTLHGHDRIHEIGSCHTGVVHYPHMPWG